MLDCTENIPESIEEKLNLYSTGTVREATLSVLFKTLLELCRKSDKRIVLLIDEVDTASNNQVFIDFLSQLRAYYLKRRRVSTFQSVVLAGVYDIRNIKRKIRNEEDHKWNSPWNIAAKFNIDMSFSAEEIAGMLQQYEADYATGMDIKAISELIYKYTSGYPYLVSGLCKIIDEEISGSREFPDRSSAWTQCGFYEAEKKIVKEDNPLYESLLGKLELYPELKDVLYELLFNGKPIPYVATNAYIKDAVMFGFVKNENDSAVISNRIFETFEELYGEKEDKFLESVGRRYFLLFLKPIINGIGNYSIEPQTRNSERMDLVIYYRGEQNILELKIWRGNAYNERGEKQLTGYLDYFGMKKGYMLSFNFNKKKKTGIKEIILGDKILIEAVV